MYQRRSIDNLVMVDPGHWASGHVAHNVAASASRVESYLPESVENFRERFDGDPVQLNVLANSEVGDSVGVLAGEVGDGAELPRGHHAVGNADANHEALQRFADSACSPGYASAVALGVNAP